jgi:hypothetical protein
MLAAISYDLRTPLTALRVRTELIDDKDTRDTICATLADLQRMTEATLAFVHEEAVQEDISLLGLNDLVNSVLYDLSDTGHNVTCCGPGKLPYRGRAVSLKRALRHLVENATASGCMTRTLFPSSYRPILPAQPVMQPLDASSPDPLTDPEEIHYAAAQWARGEDLTIHGPMCPTSANVKWATRLSG